MDRDEYADMFRFQMGQYVRWAEYPNTRYYIYQRRWTQREILDPVVQYRFRTSKAGTDAICISHEWVHERDLQTREDQS